MTLSDPCKVIMQTLKKVARTKVAMFRLRPGVQSMANESEFRSGKIDELIGRTFPPKFTLGVDEFGNSHFLENEVVWEVVLDAIAELKLYDDLIDLDSMFCAAAAALHCALRELVGKQFIQVDFAGEVYRKFYDQLLDHLKKKCLDQSFLTRWKNYKDLTDTRLKQICSD